MISVKSTLFRQTCVTVRLAQPVPIQVMWCGSEAGAVARPQFMSKFDYRPWLPLFCPQVFCPLSTDSPRPHGSADLIQVLMLKYLLL